MTVGQGIIQLATHPPFGILSRETLGPLTAGVTSVYRTRGAVNVDAFGLAFSFFTIPAAFGSDVQGVTPVYENKICQFAPVFTDLSGHDLYGGAVDVYSEGEYYYFPDLFPTRVDVWVQTGCVVILDWLVAL